MEKDFDREELIRRALEQQKMAYAPYSEFFVAAAVLMDSGRIYTGVECGECLLPGRKLRGKECHFSRGRLRGAKNQGDCRCRRKKGDNRTYAAPCGICRQVMREFCNPKEMTVMLAKTPEDYREMTLEDLLPMSFGPEHLPGFGGEA